MLCPGSGLSETTVKSTRIYRKVEGYSRPEKEAQVKIWEAKGQDRTGKTSQNSTGV